MSDKAQVVRVGTGPLALLGILFVGLKLTGFISWSWWWVTAPFWVPFAVFGVVFTAIAVVIASSAFVASKRASRRKW